MSKCGSSNVSDRETKKRWLSNHPGYKQHYKHSKEQIAVITFRAKQIREKLLANILNGYDPEQDGLFM